MRQIPAQKIYIASDHAGFSLKKNLIEKLQEAGFQIFDLGCHSAEISVDYPDYANALCSKIKKKSQIFGILICGSGVGISIAANRFKHVRAALCRDVKSAKLARAHNDANAVCLGARAVKDKLALSIVKAFLTSKFEGGRHEARVAKLSK